MTSLRQSLVVGCLKRLHHLPRVSVLKHVSGGCKFLLESLVVLCIKLCID
jgi:hypothetical protein